MRKLITAFMGIVMLTLSVNYVGCLDIPDEIILPEWDVELNVPILNRYYTLTEIVEPDKEPFLEEDSVENVFLVNSDEYTISSDVFEFLSVEVPNAQDTVVSSDEDGVEMFVGFPEGAEIVEAEFIEGSVSFSAENLSPATDMTVNVFVPGVLDPQGNPLEVELEMGPGEFVSETIILNDYNYVEPDSQLSFLRGKIWVVATGRTPTGIVAAADFEVITSDFLFSSARGYLPEQSLGTEERSYTLSIGEDAKGFRDNLDLVEADLKLTANYLSSVNDPFVIGIKNLEIVGKRNEGSDSLKLRFTDSETLDIQFMEGHFDTTYSTINSNISDFISFMPQEVIVRAEYIMNPDDDKTYHSVTNRDSVFFTASFTTKSNLSIKRSTVKDTTDVGFTREDRDAIRDANNANLSIVFENGIPLSTFLRIELTDADYNPLFVVTRTSEGLDSLEFFGAEVDSVSGLVEQPTLSSQVIELSPTEVEQLANAYYALVSISVRTKDAFDDNNNPPQVFLRPDQWVRIRSFGGVDYRIKPEDN